MIDLEIEIEPQEPLLFGDNRSARAGLDHSLHDQDPSPAALYGAVGARIAGAFGARGKADWQRVAPVLGPFRDRLDQAAPAGACAELRGWALSDPAGDRWFPRPLPLRLAAVGEARFALPPARPGGAAALTSLAWPRLLAWEDPPGEAPDEVEETCWVDAELLAEYLTGRLERDAGTRNLAASAREPASFYLAETRAGLAMDNLFNVARERLLFSRPYRRFVRALRPGAAGCGSAGFCAWLAVPSLGGRPAAELGGAGFLGGDRRRAHLKVATVERPLAHLCEQVAAAAEEPCAGFLACLLTPGPADAPALGGYQPVAAAIGRPVHVSGWDSAAGEPRPMRAMAPAGSTYFFAWRGDEDPAERRALIVEHWLDSVAGPLRVPGFGRVLLGVWR